MTGIITLTAAGLDTGPFDIYSDVDGYITPFENLVDKAVLLAGYPVDTIPIGTQTVRVQSVNSNCINYIDVSTTTTTTTTI